jgi:hypothetical protein
MKNATQNLTFGNTMLLLYGPAQLEDSMRIILGKLDVLEKI